MNIYGYDAWKLSNPWDDGHYGEEEKQPIEEAVVFKYRNHTSWTYGMITKEGYDVRVHRYSGSPSIEISQMDATMDELDDAIHQIKTYYSDYTEIDFEDFEEQYNEAREAIHKIITA